MPFTITRKSEQVPSYPMLCRLAQDQQLAMTGNEHAGSFSGRGVNGNYAFGETGLSGTVDGHGVTGAFSFEVGKAAVTVSNRPFWLPEMLLKQRIVEALEALCKNWKL